MALKREIELKLGDAGLIQFFKDNRESWEALAQKMYDLVETLYPPGSKIRPDDVAEYLLPALKVDEGLRNQLAGRPQNYWYNRFGDLVIDRCWDAISAGE